MADEELRQAEEEYGEDEYEEEEGGETPTDVSGGGGALLPHRCRRRYRRGTVLLACVLPSLRTHRDTAPLEVLFTHAGA
jgi:hypothetical protein